MADDGAHRIENRKAFAERMVAEIMAASCGDEAAERGVALELVLAAAAYLKERGSTGTVEIQLVWSHASVRLYADPLPGDRTIDRPFNDPLGLVTG